MIFGVTATNTRTKIHRVTIIVVSDCLKTKILYNRKIIILEIFSLWWNLKSPEYLWFILWIDSRGYNLIYLSLSTCILKTILFFFLIFKKNIWNVVLIYKCISICCQCQDLLLYHASPILQHIYSEINCLVIKYNCGRFDSCHKSSIYWH